jgi:hypothetical protein
LSANPRDSEATSTKILSWPMQRLMRCLYRPNPQGRDALRCAGASIHEGRIDRRWPSANANADTGPPVRLAAIRRRFGLSTASHPSGPRGDGHEATGEVFARTAIQPFRPLLLRAMMRKPSCLISCSHSLPEGSLSVLVGRHGAMNPAGRIRCNMCP